MRPMRELIEELKNKKCERCDHPPSWHRHDDVACRTSHPQPCHPDTAPFRCLGYDCEASGPPRHKGCDCPDFVGPDLSELIKGFAVAKNT